MPDARLTIEVSETELTLTGRDQVAILLQPHVGTRAAAAGARRVRAASSRG